MKARIFLFLALASVARASSSKEDSDTEAVKTVDSPDPPTSNVNRGTLIPRPLPASLICRTLCGKNSVCKVIEQEAVCSCPPGRTGNPEDECVEITETVPEEIDTSAAQPNANLNTLAYPLSFGSLPVLMFYGTNLKVPAPTPLGSGTISQEQPLQQTFVHYPGSFVIPFTSPFAIEPFAKIKTSQDVRPTFTLPQTQSFPLIYPLPSIVKLPIKQYKEPSTPAAYSEQPTAAVAPYNFAYNFQLQYQ